VAPGESGPYGEIGLTTNDGYRRAKVQHFELSPGNTAWQASRPHQIRLAERGAGAKGRAGVEDRCIAAPQQAVPAWRGLDAAGVTNAAWLAAT
jgi:hypothetical protein